MDLGNRIIAKINRPDKALVEAFRGIPSSNIGDMMNRLYCMKNYIKAFSDRPLLGTALTVKAPEGDNVFLHRAMDFAKPGDVIVVDGRGCESRALMGEMMMQYAVAHGIEGFIVDGAIRDIDAIPGMNLSMYAKAVTPEGPYKNGPGEINVPISCGGLVVFPGDIIVGDKDGICVIPPEYAEEIAKLARAKFESEQKTLEGYKKGIVPEEKHKATYIAVTDKIGTLYNFSPAD